LFGQLIEEWNEILLVGEARHLFPR
jgi:hypothetical protein